MNKFWGILFALLLIFGSLESANATIINLEDIAKNLVSEYPKFDKPTSPALKRSKIKQQCLPPKAQDQNGTSSAPANVIANGNFAGRGRVV